MASAGSPGRTGRAPWTNAGRLAAVLAALALLSRSPLAAQVTQKELKLTSAGSTVFEGVYVGPYQAMVLSAPGMPTIDVFCIDYLNSIKLNQVWTANLTPLSFWDLSSTRFQDRTQYRQAAWLAEQFRFNPTTEWGSIAYAIWNVTTPGTPALSKAANGAYWLAQAQDVDNYSTVDLRNWFVVTDVNTVDGEGGVQEYLTHSVVPEPATILLLGTGLLVLAAGALARRGA